MQWFRMYAKFATDLVVQSLAFEDQRHYVILLCLKCDGILDRDIPRANKERLIYRGLGLDPHAAEEAKKRLLEAQIIDKNWQPTGWNKLQFKSDDSAPRVRKSRENKETHAVTVADARSDGNAPETEADTETEADISTTDVVDVVRPHRTTCPATEILNLYHETLPTLRRVADLTPARRQQLKARWTQAPSLEDWRKFFEYVGESDFLMGRGRPRPGSEKPFQADFDWLTKQANFVKVIEGKYHA